jgi:phosphoglycolate phosphatase-like HAD superfamily hydrolase
MKETIETLHKKGYFLGIVTSNTEKNVLRFLEINHITSFDFIHDEKNIFGKGRTIKSVIKKYRLNKNEAVYVGDEVRDIEAAEKSGIRSISVSWGFNTKKLLQRHSASTIVNTPQELLQAILSS